MAGHGSPADSSGSPQALPTTPELDDTLGIFASPYSAMSGSSSAVSISVYLGDGHARPSTYSPEQTSPPARGLGLSDLKLSPRAAQLGAPLRPGTL